MMTLVRGETTQMGVGVNTMAAVTGSVWLDRERRRHLEQQ